MAQLDDLNAILSGIATDAASAASDHANLIGQLQTAQAAVAANQPVDLTGAIASAQAIKATLDGIVQATTAAPASTTPAS